MTAKHTPGPWYTGEPFATFEGGTLRFHISQADGAPYTPHYSDVAQLVAETVPGELLEIQKANARLIAAAPDLLESQTMGASLNTPDFMDWIADRLVNVHGESPDVDYVRSLRERANSGRAAIAKATGEQA